ncbi:hypothetical protein SAM40697_0397 [Streptomyces ambofaciens]|uniref:Uncharacterized protein n=1 Tax=Streptomyces ambofaciens TaxID=1889 RepID=A0ABN4NZK7_STRAM|nr:hypothetical protein [Streptomyces ambofaciens]ANB04360.1 hypothetical protein SAM40697_0397 [Streptomyces ambofaciens]
MPTATIVELWCLKPATGTDFGHLTPHVKNLLSGFEKIFIDEVGQAATATVQAIPGLVQALDEVQADPDSVYLTVDATSGLDNSVWPGGGETRDMNKGQVAHPSVALPFDFSTSLTLWERDSFLDDDDPLGTVRIDTQDTDRGHVAQVASSEVEGSFYYVTYRVDS